MKALLPFLDGGRERKCFSEIVKQKDRCVEMPGKEHGNFVYLDWGRGYMDVYKFTKTP